MFLGETQLGLVCSSSHRPLVQLKPGRSLAFFFSWGWRRKKKISHQHRSFAWPKVSKQNNRREKRPSVTSDLLPQAPLGRAFLPRITSDVLMPGEASHGWDERKITTVGLCNCLDASSNVLPFSARGNTLLCSLCPSVLSLPGCSTTTACVPTAPGPSAEESAAPIRVRSAPTERLCCRWRTVTLTWTCRMVNLRWTGIYLTGVFTLRGWKNIKVLLRVSNEHSGRFEGTSSSYSDFHLRGQFHSVLALWLGLFLKGFESSASFTFIFIESSFAGSVDQELDTRRNFSDHKTCQWDHHYHFLLNLSYSSFLFFCF